MEDIVDIISKPFPLFAAKLTTILFVIYLVLRITDDYDKIKKVVIRVLDVRKHIDTIIYKNLRKHYDRILESKDYLEWQRKAMTIIYGDLIKKLRKRFEDDKNIYINMTTLDFPDDNRSFSYEAVTLRLEPQKYPFKGVCKKERLETSYDITATGDIKRIIKPCRSKINKYYRLVRATIRYPKRLGFMLKDIEINKKDTGSDNNPSWEVTAYSGTYENNVKTSHFLEYELYCLYKKHKNLDKLTKDQIMDELKLRKQIHDEVVKKYGSEEEVLLRGAGRQSLLGVQMFVMVKNYSGSYDALRIRRSKDVSVKPGFLQFVPSGGFEAINDCSDFDSQMDNYSIQKAIFRELLEECFGQDEDDKKATGNNITADKIYHNEHIKQLLDLIKNNKAHLYLLGTTMGLVGLRHELSFILKVDEPDFASSLIGNYESKSAIHLVDIRNLEKYSFWHNNCGMPMDDKKEKQSKKTHSKKKEYLDDLELLNCTSAGLFELARKSELYK